MKRMIVERLFSLVHKPAEIVFEMELAKLIKREIGSLPG
jgi:hypothetical protein